jgi:AcrR family transcriptional regulator
MGAQTASAPRRSTSSELTRNVLVSTAETLFAERGLEGVSLAEINRKAGQRNATALHYHFGGKDGLIQAIFDKHRPRVNQLREQMIDALPEVPTLEQLLSALALPLLEQVRDADGGAAYVQFLAQMMNDPQVPLQGLDSAVSPVLDRQLHYFTAALSHVAEDVRMLRVNFAVLMVFNALARYAAEVERDGLDEDRHQLTAEQLVLAASAVLDLQGSNMPE